MREDVWQYLKMHGAPAACGFNFMLKILDPGLLQIFAVSDTGRKLLGGVLAKRTNTSCAAGFRGWIKCWLGKSTKKMYCDQPWSVLHVSRDGLVRTCCQHDAVLGDLTKNDFDTIWNGKAFREFRDRVRQGWMDAQCQRCTLSGFHRTAKIPTISYHDVISSLSTLLHVKIEERHR